MIRFYILSVFVFSLSVLTAQHNDYYIAADTSVSENSQQYKSLNNKPAFSLNNDDRFRLNMQMGSSFTNFYGGNFFNSYAAPSVSYDASQRLRLTVGTIASFTTFNTSGMFGGEGDMSHAQKVAKYYMFAKGEYLLTENINIRASTIFTPGIAVPGYTTDNSYMHNIGFDIRLGNNASIHADFRFINASSPYEFYSPMFGGNNLFFHRDGFGLNPGF